MNIRVDSNSGIDVIQTDQELLKNRKIFIEGVIDYNAADRFVKKLLMLNLQDDKKLIDIIIDSPGSADGDIKPGLMIYDALHTSAAPIRMFCIGRAYGIAGVLFVCGKWFRIMLPNAYVSFSENRVIGTEATPADKAAATGQALENTRIICELLKHYTGKSSSTVRKMAESHKALNSQECLKKNLSDLTGGIDWMSCISDIEDNASLPFPA